MEEKIKVLEQMVQLSGLSLQEVVDCWLAQKKVYVKSSKQECKTENVNQAVLSINQDFPSEDIRSRTKLHWYAFEGKKFAPNHDAYPNCQGVVGWINPDPNAPEGDRVYIVLPEQIRLKYSQKYHITGAEDLYDGRANTKRLLEYGKQHNVEFPAAELAYNYRKNGVKQGEAFLPAREQLVRVCEHLEELRKSLKKINGKFAGWLWSSSEHGNNNAWLVSPSNGLMTYNRKSSCIFYVSCFLAY